MPQMSSRLFAGLSTGSHRLRPALLGAGVILLAACAVSPAPLTEADIQQAIAEDLDALFTEQAALDGPIGLHEAMARALRYNIDRRVELQQQLLAMGQFDLAQYDLLPVITGRAGVTGRDRENWSSSRDQGQAQPGTPSLSQDRDRGTADIGIAWNVLDFGVSYYAARQHADRTLVAEERRRQVINGIVQDVRSAYWRAVAAERMLQQIEPLTDRVERALGQARELEARRIGPRSEALAFQRALLDILQQLEGQRRELRLARAELAALINLPPGAPLEIALPPADSQSLPSLDFDMDRLELTALANRPEVREERYEARIARDETRKALARLLPGIELHAGFNYDSNSFLSHNQWAEYGVRVTWNLMNALRGPTAVRAAEASEAVVQERRLSISMAVLTQLHVAQADFLDSLHRYGTAEELRQIDQRLLDQARAEGLAARIGELAVIRAELDAVQSGLIRDLIYADLQNAFGRLLIAVGADPLPATATEALPLADLADLLRSRDAAWQAGTLDLATGDSRPQPVSQRPALETPAPETPVSAPLRSFEFSSGLPARPQG